MDIEVPLSPRSASSLSRKSRTGHGVCLSASLVILPELLKPCLSSPRSLSFCVCNIQLRDLPWCKKAKTLLSTRPSVSGSLGRRLPYVLASFLFLNKPGIYTPNLHRFSTSVVSIPVPRRLQGSGNDVFPPFDASAHDHPGAVYPFRSLVVFPLPSPL